METLTGLKINGHKGSEWTVVIAETGRFSSENFEQSENERFWKIRSGKSERSSETIS